MRSCLIGGAGLLGSHLAAVLLASGRTVVVLDPRPPRVRQPGVEYVVGHYEDSESFARTLATCDEWLDLAYATQPKTSFEDPLHDLLGNVPAAVALFRRALKSDHLHRILFVSSGGTVYGPVRHWPIPESADTNPISPYGITKLTIEKYAFMYHRTHGLPALVVRPSNAYGPGQLPFTGQGFIATAIGSAIRGQGVPVFGGGQTVRDYIYVEDLARGILAALDHGAPGEAYNLGTGNGLSNMAVLQALAPIARRHGRELVIDHQPARGFDVPVNVLDISKIAHATGWRPVVAFDAGLARTWEAIESAFMARPAVSGGPA
jgi:UDP-glucose 4-epimerase